MSFLEKQETYFRHDLVQNAAQKYQPLIEHQVVISLVALMPLVDSDRIKLITYKWRTNADIKERDVHCRENLKQL
ncbi:hypothetical protein T12_7398 [Trichinella patagoniensis]|uniref:Uncharacterized protein n=1 Tax=Trichinella patagoniensis TaxID=990121 RepID=A0A0V0Z2Q5_9BILA|nr:hypothetical protein T12_7398 [Trichinella patagoniensis]